MKDLLIEVQGTEYREYQRAAEKFGKANNSPHESYAVILEERDEAVLEMKRFDYLMSKYWEAVKSNDAGEQDKLLGELKDAAECAAAEWIQAAAMCFKATVKKDDSGERSQ